MCVYAFARKEGRESPNETRGLGIVTQDGRWRGMECMNDESCLCDDPRLSIRWKTGKKRFAPDFGFPLIVLIVERRWKDRDFFPSLSSSRIQGHVSSQSILSVLPLSTTVTVTDEHHSSTFDHQLV